MYMSYMVLGVHSFAHFLLDLVNKKNVNPTPKYDICKN